MDRAKAQDERCCGLPASARTNVRLVAALALVVLNAGQIAGCNSIAKNATLENKARFIDHVCVGLWPICMSYDIAYDYMKQRIQRNVEQR